jgi:predicted N-acyltransferase
LILADGVDRKEVLCAIVETAQAAARQQKASFVTFDYLNAKEIGENWQSVGFSPLTIADPGTHLALPETDFEEWVKHLAKSAQKDYRRHMHQAQERGITVSTHSQVSDVEGALALVRGVERHHKSMPKPWARRLLSLANQPNAAWLAAWCQGKLVGCGLILNDGQAQMATLLGINYQVQYVYFQLMYSAIRNAFEQKAGVLRAGSGAYPFKSRLGFTLEDNNFMAYAGCGPAFHRLGQWLSRF